MLSPAVYRELLGIARRHARKSADAEDLLHDALAVAIAAGRHPGSSDRAWLAGVMRNLAAMQRRSSARRQRREQDVGRALHLREPAAGEAAAPLPPGLRVVLLLALSGHSRAEIRYLLNISDDALRQRIADIRRRWPGGNDTPREFPGLASGVLAYGAIRRSLLPLVRRGAASLASHDPDGHAIAVGIPAAQAHKTIRRGNNAV